MSLVVKSFEMLTITKEILPTTNDQRPKTNNAFAGYQLPQLLARSVLS